MTRITYLAAMLTLAITTASCDRPTCENSNPTFDRYLPETKEYKDELVNQLSRIDKSKLTYWVETYRKTDSLECVGLNIQGGGLCAKINLLIKDSKQGIEDIVEHEGRGYIGAELQGLKFNIIQDSVKTEFVFNEISDIVD